MREKICKICAAPLIWTESGCKCSFCNFVELLSEEELEKELRKCDNDDDAKEVGVEWCIKQCKELVDAGVPSVHFYSMNAVDSVRRVAQQIY